MGVDARKLLLSAPVSSPASLNAAAALDEAGLLGAYYSTLAFRVDGGLIRSAALLDRLAGSRLVPELQRRVAEGLPGGLVHGLSALEVARTLLSRAGLSGRRLAGLTRLRVESHDRRVAAHAGRFGGVYGYRGGSLESFLAAKRHAGLCIYDLGGFSFDYVDDVRATERLRHPRMDLGTTASSADWPGWRERVAQERALADLVIFNSQLSLQSYPASGFGASMTRVVPLGFPEPATSAIPETLQQGPLKVMWAGAFSILKGAHYLLAALDQLEADIPLSVQVFGKREISTSLLAGRSARLSIRPTIPRARLMEEYRRHDVLVMPTLSDGFGMVISEAMSQGLAVITTDQAGASSFIESGRNGLVIPAGSASALAAALTWSAGHRDELRAMGAAARVTAASWQWSDYRKALAETVIEALEQRSATRAI